MQLDFFVNSSMEYFLDKDSTDVTQQILLLDFFNSPSTPQYFRSSNDSNEDCGLTEVSFLDKSLSFCGFLMKQSLVHPHQLICFQIFFQDHLFPSIPPVFVYTLGVRSLSIIEVFAYDFSRFFASSINSSKVSGVLPSVFEALIE